MQAFGPYKTSETIDFAELGANKLFLIHGDTGAGKTSILDGIVFALYGDTSGGERQAAQMRCESADPALLTEVELTFALGRRTFRVLRSPKQDIAARGGGRLVTKQASAALWDTTDAEAGSEGKVLGTRIREVNDAVRDLLGFSSEQFRQVVVLPQGKFRDLLAAGSDKREEILKQLFRTEGCADLERRLKERARDAVKQRDELQIARRTRLEAAGAEDVATLEALMSQAATSAAALKREATKAEKLADRAAKALSEAEKADEAAGAVVEAEGLLAQLKEQQPHIDELKAVAERAREAEKVAPLAEALDGAVRELGDAEVALSEAGKKQTQAVTAEKVAAKVLQKEEKRAPERAAAAEQVRHLAEMREKVTAWEEAEGLRKQADKVLTAAAEELQKAQAVNKVAKEAQEESRERVGKAGAAATGLQSAEQKRAQAGRLA
jgi:exonuclease SbcC